MSYVHIGVTVTHITRLCFVEERRRNERLSACPSLDAYQTYVTPPRHQLPMAWRCFRSGGSSLCLTNTQCVKWKTQKNSCTDQSVLAHFLPPGFVDTHYFVTKSSRWSSPQWHTSRERKAITHQHTAARKQATEPKRYSILSILSGK